MMWRPGVDHGRKHETGDETATPRGLTSDGPLRKHYLGSLRDGEGTPPGRGSQRPRGGVVESSRSAIEAALEAWLAPFLAVMGRVTRRRWAPLYLHGLLGPDGRKSLQPLAARLGLGGHDQLQHFIASPAWDDEPLRRVLAGKADALVGGPEAVLVIDDTALPKKGERSVGVARQYCGCLGKQAGCQVLVSLTLARGEVPLPRGLRLFLPDGWTADPARCARAGVPEEHRRALTKPDLAL